MPHIRQKPDITPARLRELYRYDAVQGTIHNARTNRLMFPDENGLIACWDGVARLQKKFLYRTLAWVLNTGEVPPTGVVVLCVDLDDNNIKGQNLKLVEKKVELNIRMALRNLNTNLKITQHPKDAHAYILQWSEYKAEKKFVYYDIGAAEKAKHTKQLEFVKLINKYIRSN